MQVRECGDQSLTASAVGLTILEGRLVVGISRAGLESAVTNAIAEVDVGAQALSSTLGAVQLSELARRCHASDAVALLIWSAVEQRLFEVDLQYMGQRFPGAEGSAEQRRSQQGQRR
jgi:hypothetical protein